MSDALHYPFPPARAYGLNRCLYRIKSEEAFCARFARDPREATADMSLTDAEQAALASLDRDALVALGGHPYLAFMAALRLRMLQDPAALEYF